MLPPEAVDALEATLKGQTLVRAGSEFAITRSLPHGHVAAVAAVARRLGLPALLGPAGRRRDIVLALIISRVVRPKPKLSTLAWWPDTTLAADLGVTLPGLRTPQTGSLQRTPRRERRASSTRPELPYDRHRRTS